MSSRKSTDSGRFSFTQWYPFTNLPPSKLRSALERALSIRSTNRSSTGTTASTTGSSHAGPHSSRRTVFSLSSSVAHTQPELSKRLYRLIKSENNLVSAHEAAARERVSIATQLSEWGEQTADDAVSDLSDKIGVLLSEIGEQEDNYAHALDDSRGTLKSIRNTEKSVQPSRDGKAKIADEILRVKTKEGPQSTKLVVLEQELVRAEAENLVAEAQLTNITRQKLKEAYAAEFLATIERAEKQAILARHGLRLLQLLDDTPVVPGDVRPAYAHASQARQILNDAEDDLRDWRHNALPVQPTTTTAATATGTASSPVEGSKSVVDGGSGGVANGSSSPVTPKGKEVDRGGQQDEQKTPVETGLSGV